jgi:hypothetical protein
MAKSQSESPLRGAQGKIAMPGPGKISIVDSNVVAQFIGHA